MTVTVKVAGALVPPPLAFHRDAFALVMAPISGADASAFTDAITRGVIAHVPDLDLAGYRTARDLESATHFARPWAVD